MSKLDRYANASAGKREERIFLVFAKLNTKRSFSAFDLMALQDMNGELLQVAPKTMFSYLKAIQSAQIGQETYRKHLEKAFDTHAYAVGDHEQMVYAREQYRKWQGLTKTPKDELAQFMFNNNHYLDPETFYTRLEQALLVFGYLSLKG